MVGAFAGLAIALAAVWIVVGSDSFRFCIENGGPDYQDANFLKVAAVRVAAESGDWGPCFGYFLDENEGGITAVAALLTALFTVVLSASTIGLWRQTARLAELARAQSEDMRASIAAAQKSADVADRALSELERHTMRNVEAPRRG